MRTALHASIATDLIDSLDPAAYLSRLGYSAYPWQVCVLDAIQRGERRIHIVGARQAGKSTVTAGVPAYISKTEKALSLIYAPSDDQAKDDIERVKEFIWRDDHYPELVLDSTEHIKLPNGAYIKANTATAKTKRGKSMPRVIVFDEAALIDDELYKTVRPMLTANPNCILIALSTPYGKMGWFWTAFALDRWFRVVVKAPWDEVDGQIVEAEPEAAFAAKMATEGKHGFYSPRHIDRDFMDEELDEHGPRWFRQEYLCEFVESEENVFRYEDVARIFNGEFGALDTGGIGVSEGKALVV